MAVLSKRKLNDIYRRQEANTEQLAEQLVRAGLDRQAAVSALQNWRKGLLKPVPHREDIGNLAAALGVDANDLLDWRSSYRYAPLSPRKARLVTQLIVGRDVQDALDILKFTCKRAASMVNKVLKAAVADADEQRADVDNLYVSEARVDDAGVRIGTKRWIAKDRGRAHPISKKACHIHVAVTQV